MKQAMLDVPVRPNAPVLSEKMHQPLGQRVSAVGNVRFFRRAVLRAQLKIMSAFGQLDNGFERQGWVVYISEQFLVPLHGRNIEASLSITIR